MRQGVFAGQGALDSGALFSSRTGCHRHRSAYTPCPTAPSREAALRPYYRAFASGPSAHRSTKGLGHLPHLRRRKHATTRPQPTKYPPRMPPSAHAHPRHADPQSPQQAAAAGSPQSPSVHRRPLGPRMYRPVGVESRTCHKASAHLTCRAAADGRKPQQQHLLRLEGRRCGRPMTPRQRRHDSQHPGPGQDPRRRPGGKPRGTRRRQALAGRHLRAQCGVLRPGRRHGATTEARGADTRDVRGHRSEIYSHRHRYSVIDRASFVADQDNDRTSEPLSITYSIGLGVTPAARLAA
jgi:hypothetical protein